jgi:hypothetical protein
LNSGGGGGGGGGGGDGGGVTRKYFYEFCSEFFVVKNISHLSAESLPNYFVNVL